MSAVVKVECGNCGEAFWCHNLSEVGYLAHAIFRSTTITPAVPGRTVAGDAFEDFSAECATRCLAPSWTDIAGYAACGHECVEEGE